MSNKISLNYSPNFNSKKRKSKDIQFIILHYTGMKNDKNFKSLEKNSIDLYSSFKSIYLQDRENKVKNSIDDQDEWGNLDN